MMKPNSLRQQFITDTQGNTIGVLLPIEDYQHIAPFLQQKDDQELEKLTLLNQASQDPLFLADLQESMNDFQQIDSECRR